MEKAYDIKALVAKFKGRGLDLTEEAAKMVLEESCDWLEESAALSVNKFDDMAALGIPQVKKLMLPLIDKIDGQEG
jgi:hypothetical protein